VLPPSLIYDVILSPFVLYAVVWLNGWTGRSAAEDSAAAASVSAAWPVNVAQPVAAGAVRQASSSGTPKLNLGDRRGGGSAVRPPAWRSNQQELKLNFSGGGKTAGAARAARPKTPKTAKMHFGSGAGKTAGAARAARPKTPKTAKMHFGSGAGKTAGPARAARPKTPKMHFGGGRRDGVASRGAGAAAWAAAPRFRRRSITGTVGTGGALSRATPRHTFASPKTFSRRGLPGSPLGPGSSVRVPGRGTFGRRRSFGRRSSLGGSSLGQGSFGRRPAPRLRMRRGMLSARLRRLLPHRNRGDRYTGRGGYR
jgi:hypothetical protein